MYRHRIYTFCILALCVLVSSFCASLAQAQSLTTLHSFTGGSDGAASAAAVIQARDGNLYGTTLGGGAYGLGTIFKITPSGTLTTLYSFNGSDGAEPEAALVQASN